MQLIITAETPAQLKKKLLEAAIQFGADQKKPKVAHATHAETPEVQRKLPLDVPVVEAPVEMKPKKRSLRVNLEHPDRPIVAKDLTVSLVRQDASNMKKIQTLLASFEVEKVQDLDAENIEDFITQAYEFRA